MRIAIRVDASTAIGLGHVKRCVSLAEAFRDSGAHVVFVTRDLGIDAPRFALEAGFESIMLPVPTNAAFATEADAPFHVCWAQVSWQIDARETVAVLSSFQPQCIVVDHYSFDARWHSIVAVGLSARVLVLDDLADRQIFADVLVDHNLDALDGNKYTDVVSSRTKMLVGPRFAILGAAFRKSRKYEFHPTVRSIGIFMGGIDAGGYTSLVIRACREVAGFMGSIEVVTTSVNPHIAQLLALIREVPGIEISVDLPDLSSFFGRHDLQVGAGGGAALERAALGAPSLVLAVAHNQRRVVSGLAAVGAAAKVPGDILSAVKIGDAISELIRDPAKRFTLAETSKNLVDCRGTTRTALFLLSSRLKVRQAQSSDCDMMFQWRNHPVVRASSRDPAPLDRLSHVRWMERALDDPHRVLLVGYIGNISVGVIRFDGMPGGTAEVSLYLDPELHGLGLGRALLEAGELHISLFREGTVRLVAVVMAENTASRKLFEASGYGFSGIVWEKTLNPDSNRRKAC